MNKIELISDDYEGHIDYTRHACRGIVINNNEILLAYEAKKNKYLIPGGGVENNESFLECVKREMLEETGYIITAEKEFLEIDEYFYWDKNWKHIQHYFLCHIESDTHKTNLTKTEEAIGLTTRWVTMEEALNIFGDYQKYETIDKATSGLYKREYLAIKEYFKIKITA